jgi:Flp pilus assembly protein TadB
LANLLSLKKKQQFLQTKMLNLYFIMLSLGVGLYMIEPTSNMTLFWAIFAYAITALWVLFNWFYLRPRQIKKQQKILNDMISKFENIQVQMNKE